MQTADNAYQTSGVAAELIKEILADVEETESASERNVHANCPFYKR